MKSTFNAFIIDDDGDGSKRRKIRDEIVSRLNEDKWLWSYVLNTIYNELRSSSSNNDNRADGDGDLIKFYRAVGDDLSERLAKLHLYQVLYVNETLIASSSTSLLSMMNDFDLTVCVDGDKDGRVRDEECRLDDHILKIISLRLTSLDGRDKENDVDGGKEVSEYLFDVFKSCMDAKHQLKERFIVV